MADLATDQTITYNAIPTNIGLTKIQLAMTTGKDLVLATLAYGDGGGTTPTPSPDQTSLVNQLGSTDILGHEEDLQDNVTWYSGIIEAGDASGTLRELGLFDEDGELCFVGNIPDITLPESVEGVTINLPIQLGIKNYYSKYITIKTHIKIVEQVEGSGGYSLFDLVQKDHILSYDESEGFALQGTWVHKQGLDQQYYGYPDFIQKCLDEKNQLGTIVRRIQLGEGTITGYVNPNGHIFYDVDSDKAAVDAYFEQTGVAWFWGIDENGEDGTGNNPRVFLPRNNYFFKNSSFNPYVDTFTPNQEQDFDPGKFNFATLPSLAHNHNLTLETAGGHTHTVTIGSAGAHIHTVTIGFAGSHSHSLTIYSAGSHSHGFSGIPISGQIGGLSYDQADSKSGMSGCFSWGSTKVSGAGSGTNDRYGYFNATPSGSISTSGSHSHDYSMGSAGSHTHTVSETTAGDHVHTISLENNGSHVHTGVADNKEIVSNEMLGDTVLPPSVNLLLYIVVGNVRRKAAVVIDQKLEEALERIEEATIEAEEEIGNTVTEAKEEINQTTTEAKEEINAVAQQVEEQIQSDVDAAREYSEISREQAEISEYWAGVSTAGQEQADWNQTNPNAKSYIKNKPDVDWANLVYTNAEQTLTNKTINAQDNTISNIGFDSIAQGVIVTVLGDEGISNDTLATSQAIWNAIKNINIDFNNLSSDIILTQISSETASNDTLATSLAIYNAIHNISIGLNNLDPEIILTNLSSSNVSQNSLATSQAIWNAIYTLPTAGMSVVNNVQNLSEVSNNSVPTSLAVYTAILNAASTGIDISGGEGVVVDTKKNTITTISTSRPELIVTSSYTGTQPQIGTLTYNFVYKETYNKLQTTTSTTCTNPNLIVNCYYTGTQSEVGTIEYELIYVDNEYGTYWEKDGVEINLSNYDLSVIGTPQAGDIITLTYNTIEVQVPAHWEDLSGNPISLANYYLTIDSGTPIEGDTITLTYITTSTTTISIDVEAIAALVNYNDLKGKPNYTFQKGLTSTTGLRTKTEISCTNSNLIVTSSYTGTQPQVGTIEYEFTYIEEDSQLNWQDSSGTIVDLNDYDLTVTGTPQEGDVITLTYTTENTTVVTTNFEFTNGLTSTDSLQTQTEVAVSNVDLIVTSSYTGTKPQVGTESYTFTYELATSTLSTTTSVEASSNLSVSSIYTGTQPQVGTIIQHFLYTQESSLVTNVNVTCSNPDLTVTSTYTGTESSTGTLTYPFTYRSYEWSGQTLYAWFLNDSTRVDDIETDYDLSIVGTPQEGDTISLVYVTTEEISYSGWIYVDNNEKVDLADYFLVIDSGTPQINDYITVVYTTVQNNTYHWVDQNSQEVNLADYYLTINSGTPQEGDTIGLIYTTTLGKITVSQDTSNLVTISDNQTITGTKTIDNLNSQTQPISTSSTAVATTAFVRNLQTYQPLGSFDNGNIVLQDGTSVYAASTNISAATTFTFSTLNLTELNNSVYYTFEVKFTMDNVSTLTFPANLTWQNGEAPTFEEAGTYLLAFRTMDAGTTFIGNLQGKW